MARYYTLCSVEMDGTLAPQFGDYDRETVEQEALDSYSDDETLIVVSDDAQNAIDEAVENKQAQRAGSVIKRLESQRSKTTGHGKRAKLSQQIHTLYLITLATREFASLWAATQDKAALILDRSGLSYRADGDAYVDRFVDRLESKLEEICSRHKINIT